MKFLKIASIFTLSIFAVALFSCDNEPLDSDFDIGNGENPFNPSNNLIGTWTLEGFGVSVTSTTEIGGMAVESSSIIESENEDYDLTFNASTYSTNGSYGYIVDIIVNGQSNTQDLSVQNVTGAGSYTTNGSVVTFDGSFFSLEFQGMDLSEVAGDQSSPYTISADGQTLIFTQSTIETNSEGGVMTTSVINSTSIWSKIGNSNNTCTEASDFTASAESAYNNDNTNTNLCNAYVSALQNQISACGDASGEIQAIIDGLADCTNQQGDVDVQGTWLLTAWNVPEATDVDNDGTASTNLLDEIDCYDNETLVFNMDNTGVNMSTSYAELSTEIVIGTTDEFTFSQDCIFEIENINFTWLQNGNNLEITDTASGEVFDYVLDGNQLSVTVPSGFVVLSSEDFTVTVSQDLTFVYTKQ